MGLKRDETAPDASGCLAKAFDDEPIFVIRAKDPLASLVVRYWAREAQRQKLHEPAKIKEAEACADQMLNWRIVNKGKGRF